MPKISVSIGINTQLRDGNENRFDRFTPNISIGEIDTEGDVDAQIQTSLGAARKAWEAISNLMEQEIREELGREVDLTK